MRRVESLIAERGRNIIFGIFVAIQKENPPCMLNSYP